MTRRESTCFTGDRRGSGDGELDTPSGLAFDSGDNLYVADTYYIAASRSSPPTDGFCCPLADTARTRSAFPGGWAPTGRTTCTWRTSATTVSRSFRRTENCWPVSGRRGRGDGQFTRPASVAVDGEGYIYVADWGNERVQVLDSGGNFVTKLRGESTLSEWAANFLSINQEEAAARATANLEMEIDYAVDDPHEESSHIEKYFWCPSSVKLDSRGYLYVTETNRHRIQVFRRVD